MWIFLLSACVGLQVAGDTRVAVSSESAERDTGWAPQGDFSDQVTDGSRQIVDESVTIDESGYTTLVFEMPDRAFEFEVFGSASDDIDFVVFDEHGRIWCSTEFAGQVVSCPLDSPAQGTWYVQIVGPPWTQVDVYGYVGTYDNPDWY